MVAHASVLDAPPRGVATSDPSGSRRSGPLEAMLFGLIVAAAALIYLLIHRQLAIRADMAYARVSPFAFSTHPGRDAVTFSFGPFLAVLLGSSCLAASKHRVAAFGIFALTAVTPLVQAGLGVLPADRGLYSRIGPNPLGAFWTTGLSRPQIGELWRASAIDYGLALLPAIAIAAWMFHIESHALGSRTSGRVRVPAKSEAAGLACSIFLFWLVLHTWELRETLRGTNGSGIDTDLVAFLPFFLLGAVLAHGSRWRFVALAGVPILWATTWVPRLLIGDFHGLDSSDTHTALPFVAVVVAGALWQPIASVIDGKRTRAWALVGALNALNLADVLFTRAAVHSGQAVEANPVAAWIGPGLKVVGVGVASVLVARLRPRALIWLVVAFVAVITWHLSGVVLDTT